MANFFAKTSEGASASAKTSVTTEKSPKKASADYPAIKRPKASSDMKRPADYPPIKRPKVLTEQSKQTD